MERTRQSEIARLTHLRDSGLISQADYAELIQSLTATTVLENNFIKIELRDPDQIMISNDDRSLCTSVSAVADCEIVTDGYEQSTGSFTKSLPGDLLFGTAGAIAGAVGKTKQVVSNIGVAVTVSDPTQRTVFFRINKSNIEKTDPAYKECMNAAQEIRAAILKIIDQNRARRQVHASSPAAVGVSPRKKLSELKQLFSDGLISEEEYADLRKQILDRYLE